MHNHESLKIAREALVKALAFMDVAIAEQPIAEQYKNTQAYDAAMKRLQGEIGLVLSVLPVEVAYEAIAVDMVGIQIAMLMEEGETQTSKEAAQDIVSSWDRGDAVDLENGVFNALVQIARS